MGLSDTFPANIMEPSILAAGSASVSVTSNTVEMQTLRQVSAMQPAGNEYNLQLILVHVDMNNYV